MGKFTDKEVEYLSSQRLGRLATLSNDGTPHLTAVALHYNPELEVIDIGGFNIEKSKKYRDIERDGRVAFIVDDMNIASQFDARGLEIRGRAEVHPEGMELRPGMVSPFIRIHPTRIVSWGLDTDLFHPNGRDVD